MRKLTLTLALFMLISISAKSQESPNVFIEIGPSMSLKIYNDDFDDNFHFYESSDLSTVEIDFLDIFHVDMDISISARVKNNFFLKTKLSTNSNAFSVGSSSEIQTFYNPTSVRWTDKYTMKMIQFAVLPELRITKEEKRIKNTFIVNAGASFIRNDITIQKKEYELSSIDTSISEYEQTINKTGITGALHFNIGYICSINNIGIRMSMGYTGMKLLNSETRPDAPSYFMHSLVTSVGLSYGL